jgi:hypothetical protein
VEVSWNIDFFLQKFIKRNYVREIVLLKRGKVKKEGKGLKEGKCNRGEEMGDFVLKLRGGAESLTHLVYTQAR